jgi:hypothetical protein
VHLVGEAAPPAEAPTPREAVGVALEMLSEHSGEIVVLDAYHRVVSHQRVLQA